MEAERNDKLQDVTEPNQLVNQNGTGLKSESAPSLAFL